MMGVLASEVKVMLTLLENDFIVSRCDDGFVSYDLISDWHGVLYRLQVKDNAKQYKAQLGQGYSVRAHHSSGGYTSADCDFIVAPIKDDLYIIPVDALNQRQSILLYPEYEVPNSKQGRRPTFEFEQYKNAFHLLKQRK